MIEHAIEFWRQHILLANASHVALGLGLAFVLQRFLAGKRFVPLIGWLLLAFAVVTHLYAFFK